MKAIGKKIVFLGFLAAAGCSSSPEYVVTQSGQKAQEQQAREESYKKESKQEKLKQQAQKQEEELERTQDLLDDYYSVPEESDPKADYDFYSAD